MWRDRSAAWHTPSDGGHARAILRPRHDLARLAKGSRRLAGERAAPFEVTTTVLPSPIAAYEQFLGARMRRGTKHRVSFTAADAHRHFLTSDDSRWRTFEPALRQRLADLESSAPTSERVSAALLEGLPSGLVTMETIARRLGLSKRTLQRRIEDEGTSFQQILKETREALARHYLEETPLPVADISFLLGFSEPNSFYRAFRAWTGTTPDQARRAVRSARRVSPRPRITRGRAFDSPASRRRGIGPAG
ncbi:helix-turn-helix transcriptional regulator [Sorangium cellulosum]|uniref:helix-turn-helix transcriptional regulator n=1 Tax=Sorangium cellulosum TaxID=56 RepID=UPI0003228C82|nr:helix-turn-helix transcriptional regulator [Sorangium cellulosum]